MGSKLRKNAIITGYINSYCLVCECSFDTEEETSNHIQNTGHANKLLACPYLEKYGDNHIRKVNKGYFCEHCSVLMATAAKVNLHVQEKAHYENKGTFLISRPSSVPAIIAFDNVLIGERAWHSLSDDTCAICNEEFENEDIHRTKSAHLLKLVQNKVEFGPDNSIYRQTDDSSFQCLTCNGVFALHTLDHHFTDSEHKMRYANCQEEFNKYSEQIKLKATEKPKDNVQDNKKNVKDKVDDVNNMKEEVKDTKNDYKNNTNDVNNMKKEVKDTKNDVKDKTDDVNNMKKEVKDTKNDVKDKSDDAENKKVDIKNNEEDVKDTKNDVKHKADDVKNKKEDVKEKKGAVEDKVDQSCTEVVLKTASTKPEPEDETTAFAKSNSLTYNAGHTNAFCRICETKLPGTLRSMKEHVYGKEHKSRLGKMNSFTQVPKNVKRITKKPISKFIDNCVTIENVLHQDVVLNERICIPLSSFMTITRNGARFRCQTCEVTMLQADIIEHTESPRHERALHNTLVIMSLPDSEFFREVRPKVFHCGFCNQIVPRWEEVASHLQSREHQNNKDECMWRLQRHQPAVSSHLRRLERHEADLMFREIMMRQLFRQ